MIEIERLRERARSFRRRAEWMVNGTDRDRILSKAEGFDQEASALVSRRPGRFAFAGAERPSTQPP